MEKRMRINVYSQELTAEVLRVEKASNTGITYKAVQFVLHSSPMLHHPPKDDDRSAVTFWLPQSPRGLLDFKNALHAALGIVDDELQRVQVERFNATYDANARGQYTDEDVKEVQRGLYPSAPSGEAKL
jgi:hypothetical protein